MSQASSTKPANPTRLIIGFCIGWALFSLLFFLLFGTRAPGEEELPGWFLVSINILEIAAFALASVLCFRNAGSGQIISGRGVWLPIAIAMLAYTIGDVLFALWGTFFGLDPSVSLGDFFYLLSYVFLFIGMFQAVLPRRIDLSIMQWLWIAGIGLLGVGLAYFLNYQTAVAADFSTAEAWALQPQSTLVAQAETAPAAPPPAAPAAPPAAAPAPSAAEPAAPPAATPEPAAPPAAVTEDVAPEAADIEVVEETPNNAPGWAIAVDQMFEPYEDIVGLLYVVGDCLLVVMAAMLLVAFWGGRFSQSWKLIAVAAFSLYIADMFFAYDLSQDAYVEGALWEVFWTFSAIFFAMGAAVEYEISTRSRRGSRRRT